MFHIDSVFQSDNEHTVFALTAGNVLQIYILYRRRKVSVAIFVRFIFQIDFKHSLLTLTYRNIACIYVFYHTSATGIGLDSDYTVKVYQGKECTKEWTEGETFNNITLVPESELGQ